MSSKDQIFYYVPPFAERNTTGTSGVDEYIPKLEKSDSFSTYVHVPGANGSVPSKLTATDNSHISNRSRSSNVSKSVLGNYPSSAGKDEPRSNVSKHDFDDTFGKLGHVDENHTGGFASLEGSKSDSGFPHIEAFYLL